jgi:LmbE family N-acetylglucosaminyl deacetylase
MKILVVAAHPDDEVLGCGGSIARYIQEGNEVHIGILGEGITSRYERREDVDPDQIDRLRLKTRDAASILGITDVSFYDFPDNRFDSIDLIEIIKVIEELVEKINPDIIYTHHGGDLNIDHEITFRAVLTATRPVKGYNVKGIYSFEIPSSTEWSFWRLQSHFNPNFFTDISKTLELKITAMNIYDSETREFPHPRSAKALKVTAQKWGSSVGVDAAEAFELIRFIE